jgi:hypothetical protein
MLSDTSITPFVLLSEYSRKVLNANVKSFFEFYKDVYFKLKFTEKATEAEKFL